MAEIERPVGFKVVITEYERGWGQRVDEVKYFDSEEEAKGWCKYYNSLILPVLHLIGTCKLNMLGELDELLY